MTTQIMRPGLYVMCAADHVVRFTRPSPSVFAYCKRSKTGAREGLGTRLTPRASDDVIFIAEERGSLVTSPCAPPGEKRSGEQSQISWAYLYSSINTFFRTSLAQNALNVASLHCCKSVC